CTGIALSCSFSMGNKVQALTATFTTRINTSTAASNATTTFRTNAQNVTLSATVTPASGPAVNEGTVTFTVKDGATTIGTATPSATVSGGNASVSYTLPANTAAKTYTIQAV